MTYARARLWLGMTTVGTLVLASSVLLFFDVPDRLLGTPEFSIAHAAAGLAAFIAAYACIHLISDVFGAVVIPRRFGRMTSPLGVVLRDLARGIVVHSTALWLIAVVMLLAARALGLLGVVGFAVVLSIVLLALRPQLALLMGRVRRTSGDRGVVDSPDEGFTGGIDGVFRPAVITVPRRWSDTLEPTQLDAVLDRRRIAGQSGSFRRGRIFAITFTCAGITVSAFLSGLEDLGTAAGIVRLSLWFTLWSFAGLLTLPTLSRRAIAAVDAAAGLSEEAKQAIASLDQLGDDEPERPALIETIFHPVRGVAARTDTTPVRGRGLWDVARTSLFLSNGGLGLLSRAVHCNAGRPALWVYLPSA